MRVEVSPAQLNVDPVFVASRPVEYILILEMNVREEQLILEMHGKLTSVTNEGREMFHLYAEKSSISAHDEFIL